MLNFVHKVPYTRQPQVLPTLDIGNTLTRGVVSHMPLHPGWGMRDLVTHAIATKTSLTTIANTRIGTFHDYTSAGYADFTVQGPLDTIGPTTPFSIAWIQEPRATSSYSTVINFKTSSMTTSFLIYQAVADGSYNFIMGPRASTNCAGFSSAVGGNVDGRMDYYVLIGYGGPSSTTPANWILYANGRRFTALSQAPFGGDSTAGLRIGRYLGGAGGDSFEGALGHFTIWNRAINEGEAYRLSVNPFQIYTPVTQRFLSETVAAASDIKSMNGIDIANVKTVNGISIGNVKSRNGVLN